MQTLCVVSQKKLQLVKDFVPQTPYGGSAPEPRWETSVPQTPRLLYVPQYFRSDVKGVDLTGLLGGHKEDWGSVGRKSPSGVQGRSPHRESGGRSPSQAEAFFVKLHIMFALKYNKQQLLSLE